MADHPVQGLQNVPFHLSEHLVIVERAAHRLQLPYGGYAVLLVTVLGGNEQGCAANELVVTLVDNAAGAVAVEEVDRQEEGLGQQLEGSVGFNQEVEEVGAHEPLDLGLDVNGVDVGQGLSFHVDHMLHDVFLVFISGHP